MKIFVPLSDALLGDNARVTEALVPFNPDFLGPSRAREGRKPANWISPADYASACERLRASQRHQN